MNKVLCFTAEWCAPCKAMKPTIDKLDQNRVFKYDIDEDVEARAQYEVRAVPTFIIVDADNNEVSRTVGSISFSKLQELLG